MEYLLLCQAYNCLHCYVSCSKLCWLSDHCIGSVFTYIFTVLEYVVGFAGQKSHMETVLVNFPLQLHVSFPFVCSEMVSDALSRIKNHFILNILHDYYCAAPDAALTTFDFYWLMITSAVTTG